MSMLIKLVLVGCLVWFSQLTEAMPDLKLPFPAGETWTVTRQYNDATHMNYGGRFSDDRYALDFAYGSCNDTYGKPILAAATGVVESISRTESQTPTSGYGNSIVVHLYPYNGWYIRYAHLSEIDSSVAEHGEKRFVTQGQKIGEAGGTGNVSGSECNKPGIIPAGVKGVHLHFVLYYNGNGVKPEPMDRYGSFVYLGEYTSTNIPQSSAMTQPAISCVYTGSNQQFCWKSANATPASCSKAIAWVLYDYSAQVAYNKSASTCDAYCTASNGYCKDVSGSLSVGGFGSASSFDLKINNHWFRDVATGLDLVPGGHTVRTGQVLEIRNQVKAVNGDTHDFMRPGKDRIENDFWCREDDNDWHFLGREYIQATNLPNGATHTEHITYTVPVGVSSVSCKVKIDAEDEASEANEGNNWSPVITLTVDNNPTVNFITTAIQLTNTPTPVPIGGAMRAKMTIRNIGTTAPSVGIRSSYSYRPLGSTGAWTLIADDGSSPADLVPNQDHWEEILSAVVAPLVPGWYELRGCADYQNAVLESNEADNCLTTIFEVVPPRPDFIITAVGPAGGKTAFRAGTRIYPAMYVKNIGNANPTSGIRSAYYYQGPATGGAWVYITDDGTDAGQLCVGCQYREQYDGGMKISARGTYYFMGCADYLGQQTESNEANNCTVSAPITIY